MKIVIVNKHRDDALGGSELQCDFIASELVNRGYEVFYIAPDGSQESYNRNYRVIPCKEDGSEIVRHVLHIEPDIVYWRFNKNFFYYSARKLKEAKIPIIFAVSHIRDLKPWVSSRGRNLRKKIKNFFIEWSEHRGFNYVDGVTVNNKEFLEKVSITPKQYVPNGMIKEADPFSWNKPYLVWVANIKKRKRPEMFINAAKEFKERGIDFIMVGNIQEYTYEWIANDKQNKLPSNFYYLGAKTIEEVNGILKNSEFHLHTCTPEGFPNIFIQAWLQKKASITYSYDPSNYIRDNNLGLCSGNNWDNFIHDIEDLLNDKIKRDELGQNAYHFAQNTFRIEKTVNALEELFIQLLENKSGSLKF